MPLVEALYHTVDPQPEQAFSFPNDSFFEFQSRIDAILAAVEARPGTFRLNQLTLPHGKHREELKEQIAQVHNPRYISWLENVYNEAKRPVIADSVPASPYTKRHPSRGPLANHAGFWGYDSWTPVMEKTYEAALSSVYCAVTAVAHTVSTRQTTYALCRPPGHHANSEKFGGYCFFNNAAIAAKYVQKLAQSQGTSAKVAIFDVDYHHGNGTQDIFYEDGSVLYVSIHADPDSGAEPFYTGYRDELGEGDGLGTTYNIPLPPPITDDTYRPALTEALKVIESFRPSYLIVSLGCDIFEQDPLAHFGGVSVDLFREMGAKTRAATASIPAIILQEGGYNVDYVGACVTSFFEGFCSNERHDPSGLR